MATNLLHHTPSNTSLRLDRYFQAFRDILFVFDQDGKILECRARDRSNSRPATGELIQRNLAEIIPIEVKYQFEQALNDLKNGIKVVWFEYKLTHPEDGYTWYEARLVLTTDRQRIMHLRRIAEEHRRSSQTDLSYAYDKMIEGWSQALHLRDHETEDHTRRVIEMALRLAARLGVSRSELINIQRGATLHDIGKIAIPNSILWKADALTEEEWKVMRLHPILAETILKSIFYFSPALSIPRSHHEKWDGSGYPDGLVGENIPLFARIFSFADVYDALTSDRPYRRAWAHEDALEYIRRYAGRHFDPKISPVFLSLFAY